MKKRILFVDDDPMILLGLQRALRSMCVEWEMRFVERGCDALAAMAEGAFDVVVTDMHLQDMHGLRLLAATRARFPRTVRLVLSGDAECDLAASDLGIAQQFLNKPCSQEDLIFAIKDIFKKQDSRNEPIEL
jgi:DNA-binding NtrC family response regulator